MFRCECDYYCTIVEYLNQSNSNFNKLFTIPIAEYSTKSVSFLKRLKNCFAVFLSKEVNYKIDNRNSKTMVFLEYKRKDYCKSFYSVISLLQEYDELKESIKDTSFVKSYINKIKYILEFFTICRNNHISLCSGIFCLPTWLEMSIFLKDLEGINLSEYNTIITYCDAWNKSNILTILANLLDICTVTLQHGLFLAPVNNPKNFMECGAQFKVSSSKYFLTWSQMLKDRALKSGLLDSTVFILGNPKLIETKSDYNNKSKLTKGVFGVVLGHKNSDKENRRLLHIANQIAKKKGYKIYLRYHPTMVKKIYDQYIESKYLLQNSNYNIGLNDYIEQVDFSIVGNSTVMLELLGYNHITFHLISDNILDYYPELNKYSFFDLDSFEKAYDDFSINKQFIEYVNGPSNVKELYANFFKNIL